MAVSLYFTLGSPKEAPKLKLPASKKTAESQTLSPSSATTSFIS